MAPAVAQRPNPLARSAFSFPPPPAAGALPPSMARLPPLGDATNQAPLGPEVLPPIEEGKVPRAVEPRGSCDGDQSDKENVSRDETAENHWTAVYA